MPTGIQKLASDVATAPTAKWQHTFAMGYAMLQYHQHIKKNCGKILRKDEHRFKEGHVVSMLLCRSQSN
jgi:hypothetical protein